MILYTLYTKISNVISQRPLGQMQLPARVFAGEIIIFANKSYKILAIRYNVVNSSETKCELLIEETSKKWGIV